MQSEAFKGHSGPDQMRWVLRHEKCSFLFLAVRAAFILHFRLGCTIGDEEPISCDSIQSIWIYEGNLQIEYQETLLAQYQGDYDWRKKGLQGVSQPTLYQTPFSSPQLEMFELDDEQ